MKESRYCFHNVRIKRFNVYLLYNTRVHSAPFVERDESERKDDKKVIRCYKRLFRDPSESTEFPFICSSVTLHFPLTCLRFKRLGKA